MVEFALVVALSYLVVALNMLSDDIEAAQQR